MYWSVEVGKWVTIEEIVGAPRELRDAIEALYSCVGRHASSGNLPCIAWTEKKNIRIASPLVLKP